VRVLVHGNGGDPFGEGESVRYLSSLTLVLRGGGRRMPKVRGCRAERPCLQGPLGLGAVGLSMAELLTRVARPHDDDAAAAEGVVPGVVGMHDVRRLPAGPHAPWPAGLPL
jgi:hypothetical protein